MLNNMSRKPQREVLPPTLFVKHNGHRAYVFAVGSRETTPAPDYVVVHPTYAGDKIRRRPFLTSSREGVAGEVIREQAVRRNLAAMRAGGKVRV